ncbi:MAG: nicotinamide riboside transporter PnuC [Muribaculaceae bacterium]|nr:nicotinamide riboside transporter PnuC [Muribaculaceae bacterium]
MDAFFDWFSANLSRIFEIVGFVLGLLYLYYEFKAKNAVWIIGIIMPMISMTLYYRKGIYADFGINFYYLIIAIYGLWHWRHGGESKTERKISHASVSIIIGCVCMMILLWLALYLILTNFTDSTVPVPDAFTTAFSIVGSWMLAKKYVEQWIVWIVVDVVSVGLYLYKGIPFYAALNIVYTVVAIFGYKHWLRKMHQQTV